VVCQTVDRLNDRSHKTHGSRLIRTTGFDHEHGEGDHIHAADHGSGPHIVPHIRVVVSPDLGDLASYIVL